MVRFFLADQLRRLRADERGGVSVIMGFLLIPLVGFLALGSEVSNWYLITRGMQNAADAATLAAAINNGANYNVEALAVAAQYGFINGQNNVTVSATNTATCPGPGGTNNCYSVSISGYTPLLLAQVVGYQGNANINGTLSKQLSAVAVATPSTTPYPICLLALASSGTTPALSTNGAPTGNMNNCSSMSNTAARCNGHNLGLDISFAVGSNSGCGSQQVHNDAMADPYLSYASNIPAWNSSGFCIGNPKYPQETHHGNSSSGGTARSGSINLPAGNTIWCGDQLLTNDVTINAPASGAVLIIENGQLDLNGHTFQTANGAALTLVFSGDPSNATYTHAPTDNTNGPGGVLNITPPGPNSNSPWQGIAIYQDPALTTGVSVSAAGNSPTWDITGLIYMPHATIALKGAIDKSTNGSKCVVMVADNFQISGTGGILKTDIGDCAGAGLNMPMAKVPGGAKLVL
jgi:Flp pilus assembly protein TadG